MALSGSVKCFKQAILTGDYNMKNPREFASAGGNSEIIHILEQKNVSFKNNIIGSSLNKIYINLSTKCFYTEDKVTSKIKNAIIKSDGIVYEKPKSKIIFLKNVRVQII